MPKYANSTTVKICFSKLPFFYINLAVSRIKFDAKFCFQPYSAKCFFSSDIKVRLLNLLRKIKSRCQWPLKKLETEKIVLMLFGQMATVRKLINITKSNFRHFKAKNKC